jgi:hypothetical protein
MKGKIPDYVKPYSSKQGLKNPYSNGIQFERRKKGEILALINYRIFVLHNRRLLQDIARLQ